jgi:hypothetical protein
MMEEWKRGDGTRYTVQGARKTKREGNRGAITKARKTVTV